MVVKMQSYPFLQFPDKGLVGGKMTRTITQGDAEEGSGQRTGQSFFVNSADYSLLDEVV